MSADYVVVGSGAGGAPAAARLAEQGYSVLVLEQGLDGPSRYVDVPLLSGAASEEKDTSRHYYVKHFEDSERAKKDGNYEEEHGGIAYPRGTGRVGGSTQINVQVWVRVDDADWESYAEATGDEFWRARNMRCLLQLVEKCEYRPVLKALDRLGRFLGIARLRNRHGHGFSGYIETTRGKISLLLKDPQILRIAVAALIYSLRLGGFRDLLKRMVALGDPNDDRTQGTEGFVVTPLTVNRQGRRSGGVRDRLYDTRRKRSSLLEIRTGATVRNIVLDAGGTAVAVRYVAADGTEHVEKVGREVILAAGAFETPAILMRSGIGCGEALREAGIEPRIELPAVGSHLHDRYEIGVVTEMRKPFTLLEGVKFDTDPADPHYAEWLATGRGVYASNGVVIGFQMKSERGLPDPDLYVFCLPAAIRGYCTGYFRKTVARPDMLTWLVLYENKGDKRGTVKVAAKDVTGQPEIQFHYHGEDDPASTDSRPLVSGVRAAREVIGRYAGLVRKEIWPGADVRSDEALREAIESCSWGHHANGSARMGRRGDPAAVVDGDLKVIGTRNVRVADASVFPHTPGSFIVSAVVQIGEAAAIKAIAEAAGEDPLAVMRRITRDA